MEFRDCLEHLLTTFGLTVVLLTRMSHELHRQARAFEDPSNSTIPEP